jgi:hypothetical protein
MCSTSWYFILFFNLIFALSKQKKLQAEIKAEDKKRRKIEDRAEVMARRSEQYIAAKFGRVDKKEQWGLGAAQALSPVSWSSERWADYDSWKAGGCCLWPLHFVEATSRNNKTPQREQSHVPCTLVYRSVLKKTNKQANKQANKQTHKQTNTHTSRLLTALIINMLLAGMFVYPNSLAAFTAPGEIMF